jgi:hypothetical protein
MSVSIDTKLSGPFFAGKPSRETKKAIKDGLDESGEETVRQVQIVLDKKMVNPSGYYRSQITTNLRRDNTEITVGDPVVYGSFLEKGWRDRPSRFRGYGHYRRTYYRMRAVARRTVNEHIARAVDRLS